MMLRLTLQRGLIGVLAAASVVHGGPDGQMTEPDEMAAALNAKIRLVGGTPMGDVTWTDKGWRCGECLVETPLPDGYPRPTAPDAIEIKSYPSVRRAEIGGTGQNASANEGFWPLFQHIQQRDIAMTAPVEMEYDLEGDGEANVWRMSFLYRSDDLGPTGKAERGVNVVDAAPVTVVAIGVKGVRTTRLLEEAEQKLDAWLASQSEWRSTGQKRWFGYNGPMTPRNQQWWELQLVIERATESNETL